MIFEPSYRTFLGACHDISRRRERLAKPEIDQMVQGRLGADTPNDVLISHIIAEALLRRIDRNLVESKNIYLERFDLSQIDLFYLMCKGYPQVPEGHALANTYLAHALRSWKGATLFEIGIGKALQLQRLIRALEEAPGRLQKLKVIALDPDPQNLADSRAALEKHAGAVEVEFHGLNALLEHLTPDDFNKIADAAGPNLVINSAYTLHHTLHAPNDRELRTQILRRVNEFLRPRLFTLVEPNANHDTEHLPRRLNACWEHFGTVFDLIDKSDIEPGHKFVIKEKFFGREIRDIFGTSDAFRCERHESFESWLLHFARAGFRPYADPVDLDIQMPAYCNVQKTEGLVRLGYRDLPLIAIFAFEAQGRRTGTKQ